jgi:hypothetical protein
MISDLAMTLKIGLIPARVRLTSTSMKQLYFAITASISAAHLLARTSASEMTGPGGVFGSSIFSYLLESLQNNGFVKSSRCKARKN